jgi:hypothetical protein
MKAIPALIMVMLLASAVSAWGPNTHLYITDQASDNCAKDSACSSSTIYQTIKAHPDAFRVGFMFPDVVVIYYYTHFSTYEATHSWDFCGKVLEFAKNDEERAAAYGCYTHLTADAVSHNYFIPKVIDQTGIPNDIIHPITEGLVEANYIDNVRAPHSLDRVDDFLPLMNRAAGQDMTNDAHLLRTAIGGGNFYNSVYTAPSDTWILSAEKTLAGAVIGLGMVQKSTGEQYTQMSIELTKKYYATGQYPPLDPSGAQALNIAGSRQQIMLYLMLIVVPIALFVLYRLSKRLKIRLPKLPKLKLPGGRR